MNQALCHGWTRTRPVCFRGCCRHWPGYLSSVISLLSLSSLRREGAGMLRCVCSERKRRSATLGPPFTHCKHGVRLSVCSSQTFADCGQGNRCGGPGEVPRPFIHPMWMRDAVWGQTVRSASQTGVHRAQWAGQTGLGSAHRTWGAPHSVWRSRVPTSYNNPFHNGRDKQRAHVVVIHTHIVTLVSCTGSNLVNFQSWIQVTLHLKCGFLVLLLNYHKLS
jgi:hypothetical protein